ncbi:hypothetical protein HMPREF1602_02060, partial [Escherichia coli 907889]
RYGTGFSSEPVVDDALPASEPSHKKRGFHCHLSCPCNNQVIE